MNLRTDDVKWTARAPAKLNLFLEVIGRRDDGFHEIETLIVPIRLFDTISISTVPPGGDGRPGEITLATRSSYPFGSREPEDVLPAPTDNLVVRALKLLQQHSSSVFGARVELVKRIPMAAGLGGGSSDAAAALKLANRAWGLSLPTKRLAELGSELGSDVPFFLSSGAAICRGRGECVEPLAGTPQLHFVVVKPHQGLNTGDVYRAHDALANPPVLKGLDVLLAEWAASRGTSVGRWLHNRLQAAAASLSPWIDEVRSVFKGLDFVGHQLSGSGSAYFGVCRHAPHARRLASVLRVRQLGLVYATRSCQ